MCLLADNIVVLVVVVVCFPCGMKRVVFPGDASLVQYVSGRAKEGEKERERKERSLPTQHTNTNTGCYLRDDNTLHTHVGHSG